MAASTVAIGEALRVLFLPTSSSDDRKRADRILNEFQRTPEAWQLADELLRAAQPDQQWTQHCRMFAAQTMRIKLQRDYKQLPAGSHLRLIEALVAHLKNLHNAPGPLVTQLCLAIASLAVNLFGTQWKDPIKDLVGTFTASAETLGILLTLIAVLPEECTNQRLLVTAAQRSAFIKYLEDSMPYVLQLLLAYLQRSGANSEEHLKIFRTLASWMRFGWGSIGAAAIATNPLLVAPFQALSSPPLFSVAVDLIVELINQTVNVQEQLPVIRAVLPQVIGLLPLFQKAVNDEDEEVAHGLCVIFSEAADIWIPLIAQLDKEALPLLDLLLACISHPDWEVGQCGLRFWKHLLRSTAQLLGEAEKSQNPQLRQIAQQKLEPFRPYFAKLFDSLRQIVRFPPEWHEWPADQQDEFKDYRAKVGDVLKLLCETLGDTTVLTRVYQLLSQQLQAYAANPDPVRGWQDIEASLYTVRSIGRHVSHTESVVLPELMKLLPQLPQHQHLHYTALLVVGRYAEWLHHHPAYLLPLLNYITAGLRSKEIASASALAFKYVCEVCAHHLVAVLPQIFEMFGGLLPPVLDWAPDLAEVVEGLARIVSVLQDPQDVQRYASQLIAPFAAKLQAILASQTRDVLNIRNNLEAIGVAFSHIRLNKSAALVPVVQQLWPLFSAFFVQYVDEASVQEKVTKCLKCIIRCLVTDFRPLLKEVTALCLQCFATRQHACYVFLSSEIVVTFSHNASPEELQLLIHLYRTVSSITLPLLTSQEQSPSVDIPDLVEEYFYFGSACARIAHALLGEAQLAGALQAAVRCLSVPHREALKGVLSFLQRWCELASPVQKMPPPPAVMQYAQRWLGETGNSLCRGIVQASIGPITAYCIPELALLIQTMLKASAPHTLQWMTDVLASFPPEILAPEEKAGILQGIQNGVQDGQAISVALDRLEELCDVLRRADEA